MQKKKEKRKKTFDRIKVKLFVSLLVFPQAIHPPNQNKLITNVKAKNCC